MFLDCFWVNLPLLKLQSSEAGIVAARISPIVAESLYTDSIMEQVQKLQQQ